MRGSFKIPSVLPSSPPGERHRAFGLVLARPTENHGFSDVPAEFRPWRIAGTGDCDAVVAMHDDARSALVGLDDVDVMSGDAFVRPVDDQALGARAADAERSRL